METNFSHVVKGDKPEDVYNTGAMRDNQIGKGRYDLISPIALKRLAIHMENGARRYADRNWEKGLPLNRYYDSAMRHMQRYLLDRMLGKDHEEDHLAAAMWNIHCLIHTEEMIGLGLLPDELDNLPNLNHEDREENL